MTAGDVVRLTPAQASYGVRAAVDAVLEVRPDDELDPSWVDVRAVEVPDLRLVAVRFPGRCHVDVERFDPQDVDELRERGATGVFVVLIDEDGEPVYARHSVAGDLELRGGQVPARDEPTREGRT